MNKLYFGHRLSCCVAWRLPTAITAICLRHLRDSGCKITTIRLETQDFSLFFYVFLLFFGILTENHPHFVIFAAQTSWLFSWHIFCKGTCQVLMSSNAYSLTQAPLQKKSELNLKKVMTISLLELCPNSTQ